MDKTLLIMTHNAGNGLAAPDKLAAMLGESGADIIGLQELTVPQEAVITRELSGLYPYRVHIGDGIPGKGILSKFPIRDIERLELYPERPDLRAIVELGTGNQEKDTDLQLPILHFIVAHPSPPTIHSKGVGMNAQTKEQVKTLISMATEGLPTVLVGDFNIMPGSGLYKQVQAAGLVDAFGVVGQGAGRTLPVRYAGVSMSALFRVDYIWHTHHLRPMEAWVGTKTGSDHLPVLARLAWSDKV